MLSFSHVSVKRSTQQFLTSHRAVRSSFIWSILSSRDRILAIIMGGMGGRVGLAASLALIPPCLPLFCFLSNRLWSLVSGGGVAVESGVVVGRRSNPSSLNVSFCAASRVLHSFVLLMIDRTWRPYMYSDVDRRDEYEQFPYKQFVTEQNTGQRAGFFLHREHLGARLRRFPERL